MATNETASPAISNFYKAVAGQIQPYIPSQFSPLELAAASTNIARRLAGGEEPDYSHFRQAVQLYMQDLPSDNDLAISTVKYDAGIVLGIPQLKTEHDRLTAARAELTRVEAEIAAAEAIQGNRLQRIQKLDQAIFYAQNGLEKWNLDFDGIQAHAEETISRLFGDGSPGSVYNQHHINAAFEDIARVGILRKLEPAAVEKLNATIAEAQSELDMLRAADPDAKPEQKAEPETLFAPEPGIKPIVTSRERATATD